MLKPMLLCATLVAGAAYPVYQFLQPPDYGLSPAHPLGEFAKLDAWIQRWKGYDRASGTVSRETAFACFDRRFQGASTYEYTWRDLPENAYPRSITIVVQGSVVKAVRAVFPSRTSEPQKPEMSSEELAHRMWIALAGRAPVFHRIQGEEGALHVDSFTGVGIEGTWTKSYRVPNSERSICDSVAIYRVDEDV